MKSVKFKSRDDCLSLAIVGRGLETHTVGRWSVLYTIDNINISFYYVHHKTEV